ncbi:MAG: hypothetical protein HYY55_03190 [Candidatus Niyogibacteria bacterium]|nr:MAG: hypothetical protein HYY55_03190 [Candidatus Niyogibacteria bacterium]
MKEAIYFLPYKKERHKTALFVLCTLGEQACPVPSFALVLGLETLFWQFLIPWIAIYNALETL